MYHLFIFIIHTNNQTNKQHQIRELDRLRNFYCYLNTKGIVAASEVGS